MADMESQVVSLDELRGGPPTISVPRASDTLGISRAHGYALAAKGAFPARVLRAGGAYRVVTASLVKLLEEG